VPGMHGFRNRREAGRALALELQQYAGRPDVIILALPRGGVPVGYEIAQALHVPLDLLVVRKLGVPGQEELAMGAIASGGIRILHDTVIQALGLSAPIIDHVSREEERELLRREQAYRGQRPPPPIEGRIVVLVDDGLATGSTMRAAIAAVRQRRPARVIVAVPVAAQETCKELRYEADEVHCTFTPALFFGVGQWYEQFEQTSDDEVRELLQHAPLAVQE
jgi:putative phosphoribosyl transferase